MKPKAIFIAATGQHVGKTTVCLGLISGLVKRFGINQVGFIKPVGQQHRKVAEGLHVDKDAVLFKEHFRLACDYRDMSPVLIPRGFTRQFLDGEVQIEDLERKIVQSYERISRAHTYTVVEGTGHIGVGSIVKLCNARVASLLDLEVIIIASGGLGSAIDELSLNINMCHSHGVPVRGVIVNRVQADKQDMILNYFPKALKAWDIPLVGCIPFHPFLSTPCMKDFEVLFKSELLAGEDHRFRHFTNTRLVATTYEVYRELIQPNQLIITPARREDIIMDTLDAHHRSLASGRDFGGGMILTGRHPPTPEIMTEIQQSDLPILYAKMSSYEAMELITSFTAKTRKQDVKKIARTKEVVEEHLDFSALVNAFA